MARAEQAMYEQTRASRDEASDAEMGGYRHPIGRGHSAWLLHSADLLIHSDTPVFEDMPGGSDREHQMAILHAGDRLTVYACIDNKSFAGYRIGLRDGRTGYVLAGNAEVEKRSFFLPPYSQPIVWNCL